MGRAPLRRPLLLMLALLSAAIAALYWRDMAAEKAVPGDAGAPAAFPPGPFSGSLVAERDLDYPGGDGTALKFDLHAPADYRAKGYPLLIWIHGGGWSQGDKAGWPSSGYARRIAELGFVVLSINYRLNAPFGRAPFPAAPDDVLAFSRYLRDRAGRFGPAGYAPKISVAGHSAGGHLALHLATEAAPPLPLACVIGIAAVTDLRAGDFPASLQPYIDGFAGDGATRVAASPMARWQAGRVTAASLFLAHARDDSVVPFSQSEALANHARAATPAVPARTMFPDTGGHDLGPEQALAALAPFLRERCA